MGGGGGQTTGYWYYMGLHAGLCHGPVDELVEIRGGDLTLWNGSQTASGQIAIIQREIYGGDQKEGGVVGALDVMMGEPTQGVNSYLAAVIGGVQSAYRGLVTTVFRQGAIGANNPYPKPWSFRVRRATKGWDGDAAWYPAKAQITLANGAKAMNPAHIVYEVLTNRDWGMGYPAQIIDTTAFKAAADQLYTEGFGLCLLWTRQDSIENFLQMVMNHISGVLVQSRTTGLFQLNLIRGGYSVDSLPVFTVDNVVEMISYESPSITGATNEVIVNWFDPTVKAKRYTIVQSLGAIQSQGVIVNQSKDYPGIAELGLASRVAQRDLQATAIPLKRVQLKLDRNAFNLLPGGLFVLTFPAYGIASMVFRVGEVDYGSLTDGAITITALQDVFTLPSTAFISGQPSGWTPPDAAPHPAPYYTAFDIPYRDLARNLSQQELAAVQPLGGYAGMVAARPSGLSINYELWSRVGAAAYVKRSTASFSPTGTLLASLAPFGTSITIQNGIDLDQVKVPCAAIIENEIVSVTALNPSSGLATIARGCVDTVPASHSAGARIWLYDNYVGSDQIEYFANEAVNMQPLTYASGGTLAAVSAPTLTANIVNRQNKPYPPALLSVNGTRWDNVAFVTGPTLSITWRERNRLTQMDQLIDNTAATITPEAGTTYTVTLKDGAGTAFLTVTGITGTSWSWPSPDDIHSTIGITVIAVRGGVTSYQSQTLPATDRRGYGLNYGSNYGGS